MNCFLTSLCHMCRNGLTDPSDEQASLRDLLAMEEVLLTGVGALEHSSKLLFVQHCVNRENWAKNRKRKQIMEDSRPGSKGAKVASKSVSASTAAKGKSQSSATAASSNQVPAADSNMIAPGSFVVLVPGVDGALDDAKFLRGKTFVITGNFPEVGGGDADIVGVANVKAMIQSFGGKTITRFSKNTSEYTKRICGNFIHAQLSHHLHPLIVFTKHRLPPSR